MVFLGGSTEKLFQVLTFFVNNIRLFPFGENIWCLWVGSNNKLDQMFTCFVKNSRIPIFAYKYCASASGQAKWLNIEVRRSFKVDKKVAMQKGEIQISISKWL